MNYFCLSIINRYLIFGDQLVDIFYGEVVARFITLFKFDGISINPPVISLLFKVVDVVFCHKKTLFGVEFGQYTNVLYGKRTPSGVVVDQGCVFNFEKKAIGHRNLIKGALKLPCPPFGLNDVKMLFFSMAKFYKCSLNLGSVLHIIFCSFSELIGSKNTRRKILRANPQLVRLNYCYILYYVISIPLVDSTSNVRVSCLFLLKKLLHNIILHMINNNEASKNN